MPKLKNIIDNQNFAQWMGAKTHNRSIETTSHDWQMYAFMCSSTMIFACRLN